MKKTQNKPTKNINIKVGDIVAFANSVVLVVAVKDTHLGGLCIDFNQENGDALMHYYFVFERNYWNEAFLPYKGDGGVVSYYKKHLWKALHSAHTSISDHNEPDLLEYAYNSFEIFSEEERLTFQLERI